MAVVVKNTPETSTSSVFDRMPVASLVGMVYVLGSLAIVFGLIPHLWSRMWGSVFGSSNAFASMTLVGMIMLAATVGLVVLGNRLLGPKPPVGAKAGIFTGLLALLLAACVSRLFSIWLENGIYADGWFGANGKTAGAVIVAIFGGGLLALFLRWFFRPSAESLMAGFEEQGWFTTAGYKKNQGMRVRRGTIVGLLVLFGSGVFTLHNHSTLARGPANWDLNVPFTGRVIITKDTAGDGLPLLKEEYPNWDEEKPLVIDRYQLRDIDRQLDPDAYVKINNPDQVPTTFKQDAIVPKVVYEDEARRLKDEGLGTLLTVPPKPATGTVVNSHITLLPAVRFTLPFLLLALTIWFAWRVVNLPTFADFLIATEAELNKVSWTTRKRLYQDTIVVLTTVLLLAAYLFAMDQVWAHLLSWKPIGVIVYKEDTSGSKNADQKPW